MATEYRLPYSANEINRRLRDVDTKANIMPLSSAEYDALEKVNANTIYMLTDIEDDDVHMVVIIDDADTASHSFSEIKAHVEAGGTAVANYGIEYYPLVLLEEGCARFAAVEDDAHIYGCNIHSDDTVEHISIDLAITVDAKVSSSSTNAVQNKAVYNYVHEAYDDLKNNQLQPVKDALSEHINTTYPKISKEVGKHKTKLETITEGANKVEASDTNGNIKIDGVETVVYTHPAHHNINDIDGLVEFMSNSTLITVEDIDTICGATITYVNLDEGAF